jgi:hypothetical protein
MITGKVVPIWRGEAPERLSVFTKRSVFAGAAHRYTGTSAEP